MLLAVLFYGLIPVAGAFVERRRWRFFRRRFSELWMKPHLDYAQSTNPVGDTEEFRFFGAFESISDQGQLWIRSGDLTVQADLSKALTYVFPFFDSEDLTVGDAPERLHWNRVSALTGDAKVFVGGSLVRRENRRIFASLPDSPLLIIFFEGPENTMALKAVYSGRHRNEFLNFLTPYSFILGAFSLILVATTFLYRPAFRITMITALVALFIPIIPWIPPGILFTAVYRRLWSLARTYRAYRDLARLPLDAPPWKEGKAALKNEDFALLSDPESLASRFNLKAYGLVLISWLFLLAGIGVNVFFIVLILSQIQM